MPRIFDRYQYETSPRKLEPDYIPIKQPRVKKTTSRINTKSKKKTITGVQLKTQKRRMVKYLVIVFLILFGISYGSSQIDENFTEMQNLKQKLADIKKENAQLEISIENGLNLNNLEQEAKEKLGMQKLNSKQTIYITLPKNDYIESASEEVVMNEEQPFVKSIIDKILNIFK